MYKNETMSIGLRLHITFCQTSEFMKVGHFCPQIKWPKLDIIFCVLKTQIVLFVYSYPFRDIYTDDNVIKNAVTLPQSL